MSTVHRFGIAGATFLYNLLAGCGYVGDPLPPALNIASPVVDLRAVEYGDTLIVDFTIPPLTTEGLALKRIGEVDLRIGAPVAPFSADHWSAGADKIPVVVEEAGPVHAEIPVSGWVGKEVLIAARVVNRKGRASSWSNMVSMTIVPPVETPSEVSARSAPEGVKLTWRSSEGAFRVFRRGPGEAQPALIGNANAPEYVDAAAQFGNSYEYLVQAVQGQAESRISGTVAVTPRDVFEPVVPAGLDAVAGLGSVELLWDRNTEPDLRGYRVYRSCNNSAFERIAELVDAPAYTDRKIETGKKYRYAISAVDQAGNESKMSGAVEIAAP